MITRAIRPFFLTSPASGKWIASRPDIASWAAGRRAWCFML